MWIRFERLDNPRWTCIIGLDIKTGALTGYAFHSRLCYPGTDTEYDYSAGYPISHGCVRMYKSDIWWIYNNIPVGTTVAIF